MKTYRIGILGCGGRGTTAARAYHAHPRTEIVALCDLIEERLNTLGEEVNVSARFTDLDEMIQQTEPDSAIVRLHFQMHNNFLASNVCSYKTIRTIGSDSRLLGTNCLNHFCLRDTEAKL